MENEYHTFSVEDFVADEDFIAWVKSNKNPDFWEEWLTANPKKRDTLEEAKKLVLEISQDAGALADQNKTRLWKRIDKSISPVATLRRLYLTAAVAAACFLVFYVVLFNKEESKFIFANQQKENLEHVFPDQSIVVLAPGSKIIYDDQNFVEQRTLQLEGRAFFEVEKGSPFTVSSEHGKVEVLGTSFDVDALNDGFKVRCFTGKVRVEYKTKATLLMPGEQTDFAQTSQFKSAFELPDDQEPEWMKSVVRFDKTNLKEVIATFEKTYKVTVEVDEALIETIQHTGILIQDDMEKALMSITWPHHLLFEMEGDVVKIYKKVD
ncbi:MAG: FecR family protein [Saprospiraceae bacterium]|nr:FecR family protein [Saprospiraceae bacterium]